MPEHHHAPAVLDFYFDFSSPYSYLASEKIEALAARFGRQVRWHPILLGVIFKATGAVPLTQAPLKGDYSKLDFARSARFMEVPFRLPSVFPLATHLAARAFYWLQNNDPVLAQRFAQAIFRALYVDDRDISQADTVLDIAQTLGIERSALASAITSEPLKQQLKDAVEAAMKKGVFGAPLIYCDGEPFMGADRLPQLEHWLRTGGF